MAKSNLFGEFSDEEKELGSVETPNAIESPAQSFTCPNRFPTITAPYRIAIIGDRPDDDAELQQLPFVGMAGKMLTGLLGKAKILREACFIGYLNDNLAYELEAFRPNICILLGQRVLSTAKSISLDTYRGSLFQSDKQGPFFTRKCIATYDPAHIYRTYGDIAYAFFDFLKAASQGITPTLSLPSRNLEVNLTSIDVVNRLEDLRHRKFIKISCDIEGYWNNLQCCSFADSSDNSFIVPFQKLNGSSYWQSEEEEYQVWKAFTALLTDSNVFKVWQNGLYDRFVLQYGFDIPVLGNVDDTMLKFWEKWCELEKGLGSQASILTNEPYYKSERKSEDQDAFFSYCCKDSAITYEINTKLDTKLSPSQITHYQLNHVLLNPILYMELRGMSYDKKLSDTRLAVIRNLIYSHQAELDKIAGMGIEGNGIPTKLTKAKQDIFADFSEVDNFPVQKGYTKAELKIKVQGMMCYVKDTTKPKADFIEDYPKVMGILNSPEPLTQSDIGFINLACKWSMNCDSPKQLQKYLYGTLDLPEQKVKKKVDGKYVYKVTTDFLALLQLKKHLKKLGEPGGTRDKVIDLVMEIGLLSTRASALQAKVDPDGRMRCGYNLVGTDTGRMACYASPTGSGFNLTTATKGISTKPIDHPLRIGMRDHFRADEGCWMAQCDLAGADGWTVGAHLARLGDPTMLDDLKFGLKPAAIICYMARHGDHSLRGLSRAEIKPLLKEVKSEDWDYFAYKQCIWGLCYTMGPDKMILVVAKKSAGAIWLSRDQINKFRQSVFARYNVHLWHRYTQHQLSKRPEIVAASGHVRRFFGRPTEILGQALAHEPQANTTYATNLAAWKLWTDKDNRTTFYGLDVQSIRNMDGIRTERPLQRTKLRIEPLHQVHDALLVQFKKTDTPWAVSQIKSYFSNEIVIAGIPITIPFEGNYGESWGNLNEGIIK